MANTNIQIINYGDTQNEIVNKLNNNFDEIVELHGGTRGNTGPTGSRGSIGERGQIGATGLQGPRGTRWFVTNSAPSSLAQEGDYWINSNTSDISQLFSTGWTQTGYSLNTIGSLFSAIHSIYSGGPGVAIGIDQILPENYLFVLSDVSPETQILNELLSKFRISTDSQVNDSPLLEFSRSDLEDGSIADYSNHPAFYWPSSDPNTYSLGIKIPSAFFIAATGGIYAEFENLTVTAQNNIDINFGSATGSIFATGGYNLVTPSEFNIRSSGFNITGGSGYINGTVKSEATLDETTPHIRITGTGATASPMKSTRSFNGNHGNLSHTVYHLNLESGSDKELFLSTKGKLKTKKTTEGVTYSQNTPSYQVQNGATSWYFISKTSTPYSTQYPSVPLDYGNTVVINPAVPVGSFVGVGFDNSTDFSWGGSGGLLLGESIDITVYNSSDSSSESVAGFKFIGVGTGGTGGTADKRVTLPFYASTIDFTLARIETGVRVHWKAYTPWPNSTASGSGGTGGSFVF